MATATVDPRASRTARPGRSSAASRTTFATGPGERSTRRGGPPGSRLAHRYAGPPRLQALSPGGPGSVQPLQRCTPEAGVGDVPNAAASRTGAAGTRPGSTRQASTPSAVLMGVSPGVRLSAAMGNPVEKAAPSAP